jgi:hypothetical protein
MTPTIRFVLITALRDRLFASLFGLLALTLAAGVYLGGAAIEESREMAVVYAAGSARAFVMLGLIVFTAFHVERLFDTREIEAILARAISRSGFVVWYWSGLSVVGALLIAPLTVTILVLAVSKAGVLYWAASLLCEGAIVIAFTIFCALTLERAIPTIFAAVGFYLLSRLVGFFLGIAIHGAQNGIEGLDNAIFKIISISIPRLDLVGQTRWLVYGVEPTTSFLGLIALQTLVYVPLLLLACMVDLHRKSF